jgi:class 3 adenylate cyclase
MTEANQAPLSQRKQATILFADLSGFTEMSANLDPEEVREIVNRYFDALASVVHKYEGTIDKYIGDCVMAAFGVPATHANDAERACQAALDMRTAVNNLAAGFNGSIAPPDVHIGINTGLVVAAPVGSGDTAHFTVMGDAVNLASRLCHEAENGEIAIGENTWAQVERDFDFAPKTLRSIKGKGDKVPVFFLRGKSQKTSQDQRRALPAMVGRARELALAQDLLAAARKKHGVLLYIVGEPGIGKSRFIAEISARAEADKFRVLSAAAQPLSSIEPYGLWRNTLEQLIGVASGMGQGEASAAIQLFLKSNPLYAAHGPALCATLGLPNVEFEVLEDAARFNSIGKAWRTVLQCLESEKPLLLVLDDLQWADAYSLRLLDSLVDIAARSAVVFSCLARPEFQHSWASRSYYHQITLRPLSAEESAALAGELLKRGAVFDDAKVIQHAEGNPFYLTELAQAAGKRGAALPATIEGVILERIDRLEPQPRQILELASVIGREFGERVLRAVAETEHVESQLLCLRELEFIYEKEIVPELLYLFKHYLTQEATYNSILIQKRKELHRQVAAAIERVYEANLDRYYSVLAQHYEKAADYKRAAECYRIAGDKAHETTSISAAAQLYERSETALEMLHEDRPQLRNKGKTFAIMGAIFIIWFAVFYATRWQSAREHGHVFHPNVFIPVIVLIVMFVAMALQASRWSFLVYPDRIRIRSKRKVIDIPFEQITNIHVIAYRHKPTPPVLWTKIKLNFDLRYPKYGVGQAFGVLRGLREFVRVDCRHGWRKGYCLDIEEPRPFLTTLDRALERYRAMHQPRP